MLVHRPQPLQCRVCLTTRDYWVCKECVCKKKHQLTLSLRKYRKAANLAAKSIEQVVGKWQPAMDVVNSRLVLKCRLAILLEQLEHAERQLSIENHLMHERSLANTVSKCRLSTIKQSFRLALHTAVMSIQSPVQDHLTSVEIQSIDQSSPPPYPLLLDHSKDSVALLTENEHTHLIGCRNASHHRLWQVQVCAASRRLDLATALCTDLDVDYDGVDGCSIGGIYISNMYQQESMDPSGLILAAQLAILLPTYLGITIDMPQSLLRLAEMDDWYLGALAHPGGNTKCRIAWHLVLYSIRCLCVWLCIPPPQGHQHQLSSLALCADRLQQCHVRRDFMWLQYPEKLWFIDAFWHLIHNLTDFSEAFIGGDIDGLDDSSDWEAIGQASDWHDLPVVVDRLRI